MGAAASFQGLRYDRGALEPFPASRRTGPGPPVPPGPASVRIACAGRTGARTPKPPQRATEQNRCNKAPFTPQIADCQRCSSRVSNLVTNHNSLPSCNPRDPTNNTRISPLPCHVTAFLSFLLITSNLPYWLQSHAVILLLIFISLKLRAVHRFCILHQTSLSF